MNPVRPDMTQPAMNASVRKTPDAMRLNPISVPGLYTSVAVANTMIASGMRMTAIVLNWRLRYAIAPTWIASAISTIFGVPVSLASTPFIR